MSRTACDPSRHLRESADTFGPKFAKMSQKAPAFLGGLQKSPRKYPKRLDGGNSALVTGF